MILDLELRSRLAATRALIPAVDEELANPDWDAASARILVARLSPFRDVDRSSSHLVLFSELRASMGEAYIDFAFFPERRDRELLDGRGLPYYFGLASGRSAADFDVVMISNAFGLELVNLAYLHARCGIPLRASEREAARSPILILGGSNAASAGCLLFPDLAGGGEPPTEAASDAMVDGIFFGEGEGAIGEIARALTKEGEARRSRIEAASLVPGFWAALSGRPTRRRTALPMPAPLLRYPTLNSPEAGTARLQITAGCPGFCSFCLEGWDRRPYREAPLEAVVAAARELRAATGADTLEVYSFNFNTHAELYSLLFELNRIFRRVNLMSQRTDILARERDLARIEAAADKRSFTLGVEGISAGMRAYYRKGLTDEDLDAAVGAILASGARELKLSYILAGIEDDSDLAEFEAFAEALAARRAAEAPGLRVLASAGYLVRLPFTPLQYAPLALDLGRLGRISRRVEAACARARIEYRLAVHPDEYCADQLLALGGPSLSRWLAEAPARSHAYDGALSRGAWPSLAEFAERSGVLGAGFLAEKGADWLPPLSFCDESFPVLRPNYEAARARVDRSPCLGADCSGCGACADGDERAALTSHRIGPAPPGFADRLGRLLAAKASFPALAVAADLPEGLYGATDEYRSSWLLRRISRAARGAEAAVFEAREALFSSGPFEGALPSFCGRCAFELRGPDAARLAAAARAAGLEPLAALPVARAAELSIRIPPPYAELAIAALVGHLAELRIGWVETRVDGAEARGRAFAIAPRGAGRKMILAARLLREEDGVVLALVSIGAKARIGDWLEACGPGAARASVIRVLSYRAGSAGD